MADLLKLDKEDRYEKQLYNLVNVDKNDKEQHNFWHCQNCDIDLTEGYFCKEHKCIFCTACMLSKDPFKVIKCKGVNIYNPLFANKGVKRTECIYLPISEIKFKEENK